MEESQKPLLHRLEALEQLCKELLKNIYVMKEEVKNKSSAASSEAEAQLLLYQCQLRTTGRP